MTCFILRVEASEQKPETQNRTGYALHISSYSSAQCEELH